MPSQKLVPELIKALDMPYLRNPLPIRRIGGAPEGERVDVEVLTVDIDPFAFYVYERERWHDPFVRSFVLSNSPPRQELQDTQ